MFTVAREDGGVKGSHGRVEQTMGHVAQWVNGLLVRHAVYLDIGAARASAERLAARLG